MQEFKRLGTTLNQYDINIREYWRILKKRKAIVLFVGVILGIFSISFAILRAPTPLYTSSCTITYQRETSVKGLYENTISWDEDHLEDFMEAQISFITGNIVLEKVAQKLGLVSQKDIEEDRPRKYRVINRLQSKMVVERQKWSRKLILIEATDSKPAFGCKQYILTQA